MKLLDNGELTRVDSTQATVTKWHEFFQTALPNMGYQDTLLAESYPYAAGIPLITGETMPVSEKTGRAFWQYSWADKLCYFICATFNGDGVGRMNDMFKTMRNFLDQPEIFELVLAGQEDAPKKFTKAKKEEYIRELLLDCTLQVLNSETNYRTRSTDYKYSREERELIYDATDKYHIQFTSETNTPCPDSGTNYFYVYFNRLTNVFGKVPLEALQASQVKQVEYATSYIPERFTRYNELCNDDYLCLSLNPVDKLMCSTKQAFSSCISLAREGEYGGTCNSGGMGIPALFPSDAVYMLFTTNGKHKNMYWEAEEWTKEGKDRDKTKAYKYLKMTSRAWTYKSVIDPNEVINSAMHGASEETTNFYNASGLKMKRIQVGRHYCTHGELNWWETITEKLLHNNGVCTTESQRDDLTKLITMLRADGRESMSLCQSYIYDSLKLGTMTDCKIARVDRYGNIRGIYFDNVQIEFTAPLSRRSKQDKDFKPIRAIAKTGRNRSGSGGISSLCAKSGLDAYKLMMGTQDYSYYDQTVHICGICGSVIETDNNLEGKFNGQDICKTCAETKELVYCDDCQEYYLAEEAAKHEKYNVQELIHPDTYDLYEPLLTCKKKLAATVESYDPNSYRGRSMGNQVCSHCGRLHGSYYHTENFSTNMDFKDITVRVGICSSCFSNAVICDKCKKLIIIDSIENAAILLPGKKILCHECIDSIRLKKQEREKYKDVLATLTDALLREPSDDGKEVLLEQRVINRKGYSPSTTKVTKDLKKQLSALFSKHGHVETSEGRPSTERSAKTSEALDRILEHAGLKEALTEEDYTEVATYMMLNMHQFSYKEICRVASAIFDRISSGKNMDLHQLRLSRGIRVGEIEEPFFIGHLHINSPFRTSMPARIGEARWGGELSPHLVAQHQEVDRISQELRVHGTLAYQGVPMPENGQATPHVVVYDGPPQTNNITHTVVNGIPIEDPNNYDPLEPPVEEPNDDGENQNAPF